jgi:hypothetical protein
MIGVAQTANPEIGVPGILIQIPTSFDPGLQLE